MNRVRLIQFGAETTARRGAPLRGGSEEPLVIDIAAHLLVVLPTCCYELARGDHIKPAFGSSPAQVVSTH